MKISNETRIGILALVAIAIVIWGVQFFRSKSLFQKRNYAVVEYKDVSGLAAAAPVLISGVQVGTVDGIKFEKAGKVVVTLAIKDKILVPKDAVAQIVSQDLMGGKVISIVYDQPCGGQIPCLESGGSLKGESVGLLGDVTKQLDPYIEKLEGAMAKIDTAFRSFTEKEGASINQSFKDVQATLRSLRSSASRLDNVLARSADNLVASLENFKIISDGIRSKTSEINGIIANLNTFSGNLKAVDIQKTQTAIDGAITKMKGTLEKADASFAQVNTLIKKVETGEGSLGLLVNDKALYNNLTETSRELDLLLQDLRLNPKRYVNVSVFGKKQKKYEVPEDDPAHSGKGK